ncbi:MAG: VCBS repeat-containing protein, partial [Acidobacteriota bacterium]|nr:VCBS repeat-containing protein [Acidobacteriota bacterium]
MTRPDTKSLGIVCCLLLTLSSCGPVETPAEPAALFVDVSVDVGLDFTHDNGMSGEKYIAEMMGPGGAFLDFDNDGDLDIYLPQGRPLNPGTSSGSSGTDRLFRNDLVVSPDGSRSFGFTDVSVEAGLTPPTGYTFGVATGDYDGDGWIDLYLTQLGTNQLLRNNGDGTFSDRTEAAGVADLRMSMPAAFFDFDGDRRLDLYVGNYLDFRVATHKRCFSPSGRSDYCGPLAYNPLPDRLFRNTGDGTFEDVTRRAGLAESRGNALGVVITDFDLDGRHGLFVANDTGENFLWRNLGDGRFQEQALIAGCALNGNGEPEGSMGVEVADLDGDG